LSIPADVKKKIFKAAEALTDEAIKLSCDLIKIPSENPGYLYTKDYFEKYCADLYEKPVTFGGEKKVNQFLEPIMKEFCDETFMLAKDPLRPNLVGIIKGTGKSKSLALNAHIDTVPTGPHEEWKWKDPFSAKVQDGKIWGRGATDDKVDAACIIMAAKAIQKAGYKLKGQLQLHTTPGEETGEGKTLGPGWFTATDKRFKTDACIIAEASAPPNRLGICPCSSGVSWLNITVNGKPVHASQRYRTIRSGYEGENVGVSAVDKCFKIYRALHELEQEWAIVKKDETGLTPHGFPTIGIEWVYGHPGGIELPFFVSDHCEIGMAVWRNPKEKYEDVKAEVDNVIDSVVKADPWLSKHPPKVEWRLDWGAFWIEKDHPLTKAVESAYLKVIGPPAKYHTWQPVSDARFYEDNGIPCILIGPGDYRVAHAYNEYCAVDEIPDAIKIYALAAMEYLGFEE